MLSIAYASKATNPMSETDIAELLVVSRANNERAGLTGALLYHRGRFIQMLEGPDDVVLTWFNTIAVDPRHRNIELLRQKQIGGRQFPAWTMGFRAPPDEPLKRLEVFEDFFGRRGKARLEHADNEAQQFLEWLAEYWLPPAT